VTAAASSVGAFALGNNSKDAALLVTLQTGSYSVVVKDGASASGTAIVEIYEVP